jgi:predicted XRE-type DNA-binding protein
VTDELFDWEDVRAEVLDLADEPEVARLREVLQAEVRAWRLAEARKHRHLTQAQVAAAMGVGQSRVSAIENGQVDASGISTISSYVSALGGRLRIVADFGDELLEIA